MSVTIHHHKVCTLNVPCNAGTKGGTVCRLGVVDVLLEDGLVRVCIVRLAAEHPRPARTVLGRSAQVLGLVIESDADL
eukprot:12137081-Alexandrium_andersonii.AAC.1